MLDFRKVLLAAAVAGLGLVSTASAQVACTAIGPGYAGYTSVGPAVSAPVSTSATGVRNEGTAEQITSIVISNCTGTLNNTTMSVTLALSVPVTNAQLTGQASGDTATDSVAVAQGFNGAATGLSYATGRSTPGSSSITYTFTGQSTTVAVANATAAITIYNLRANVSALAANAAVTVNASGSTALIAPTTTATVAYAQATLASKAFNGFANLALCNVGTGDVNVLGAVTFREAINNALTTDGDELLKETNTVSATAANYPALGAGVAPTGGTNPVVGASTIGTRLSVTFGNLASGVTYYVPTYVIGTTGTFHLSLIGTATAACTADPCGTALAGSTVGSGTNKGNVGATGVNSVYGFVPSGGSFTAIYAVSAENTATIDGDTFASIFGGSPSTTALSVAGPSYPAIELFVQTSSTAVASSGVPTVSIYLIGNTSGYATFQTPASPTVTSATASATQTIVTPQTVGGTNVLVNGTGAFNACNTTMIFPYIINTGGYDTGIALTNGGLGTSVSGNVVTPTTAGVCTMNLWGAASLNGTAVTPFALAPVNVAAGQVTAFTLSGALAGTANAAGFAGYAVASCNFQGGHGFAFITDGFGTNPGRGLSQGYLAPLLSDVFGSAYNAVNNPF